MAITNPALAKLLQMRSKITFFKGLTEDEISDLIFNIRFQKFEQGEKLFEQGDTKSKEIYYLLKGSLDLYVTLKDTNEQMKVATLDTPTLFGEMRAFIGEPRTATAIAGEGGVILITFLLKESKETQAPVAFAKFYKKVIQALSKKIMEMNDKL